MPISGSVPDIGEPPGGVLGTSPHGRQLRTPNRLRSLYAGWLVARRQQAGTPKGSITAACAGPLATPGSRSASRPLPQPHPTPPHPTPPRPTRHRHPTADAAIDALQERRSQLTNQQLTHDLQLLLLFLEHAQ
jgi:hypothetical protein